MIIENPQSSNPVTTSPKISFYSLFTKWLLDLGITQKERRFRHKVMCTLSSRQRKKQKEFTNRIRFFHLPLLRSRGRFSSRGGGEVILARCHTIKTFLVAASIVKVYVIFNSGNEFFPARKLFKIVHLRLQDAPPAFHRSIVKASADTRHALDHTRFNKLLVKHFVSILKSSVTMKYWLRIRIKTHCFIECCEYQFVVVTVAELVRNNTSVVKVKYCRKIKLLHFGTNVILEFCYVSQPFFKRNGCFKISVKNIFCCKPQVQT